MYSKQTLLFGGLIFVLTSSFSCIGGKKGGEEASIWAIPEKNEADALKIKNRMDQVAYMLEGTFSSEKIHLQSPLEFYNIVLHVYPIWKERTDARWFYVEQALNTLQDEPYRQRVYRVREVSRDTVVSETYLLPDKEKFVGAWKLLVQKNMPTPFDNMKPSQLTFKEGCDVTLVFNGNGVYTGQTVAGQCKATDRKDADYIMTEVTLTWNRLSSWDRGFDKEGAQVWGATNSGYIFDRLDKGQVLEIINRNKPQE